MLFIYVEMRKIIAYSRAHSGVLIQKMHVYLSSTSQHHSDWLEQYIFVTQPGNATLIGRNDVSGGAIECIITVKR